MFTIIVQAIIAWVVSTYQPPMKTSAICGQLNGDGKLCCMAYRQDIHVAAFSCEGDGQGSTVYFGRARLIKDLEI